MFDSLTVLGKERKGKGRRDGKEREVEGRGEGREGKEEMEEVEVEASICG